MKRLTLVLVLGLAVASVFALTAAAQDVSGGGTAEASAGPTFDEIALLFAPLAAAATGIERSLEVLWNWFETLFINFVAFIAMGRQWTRWAREEITHASEAVNQLASDLARLRNSSTTASAATPRAESALMRAMRDAEGQLQTAETRLAGVLKNDRYRQVKGATSVLVGIAMGVIIAGAAKLKMFGLLGVEGVPAGVDVFITGFVVGTGSAPVHSLIGILQSGRDAIRDTSRLLQGRYELAVNEARQPDLAAMRASDGSLSSDYKLYLSKPPA